jgi:hypothetical protein
VEIRAESLDWLPAVLARLDLPFVIDRPDELRDRVLALADRLVAWARTPPEPSGQGPPATGVLARPRGDDGEAPGG